MAPEISIIIPVYNASATLKACINSIYNQDFPFWEVLLIDDGSNDNSYEICLELTQKDNRIKVFHQIHQGVSAARNLALSKVQGKHICFVDADDTIDSKYLSSLYKYRNYDMVICGYYLDTYNKDSLLNREYYTPQEIHINNLNDKNILIDLFKSGMININCNKLLKSEIIIKNKLTYKNIPINEDYMFMVEYLFYSNSIHTIQQNLYHWNRTIGIKTGVDSLPSNIIAIYNEAHILTARFFQNETIANQILYFSYEIIIYKYFKTINSIHTQQNNIFEKLKMLHQNKYVKASISSHKPQSIGEYFTYTLIRYGLFRMLYLTNKYLLK